MFILQHRTYFSTPKELYNSEQLEVKLKVKFIECWQDYFLRALDKNHCICINYIKEKGLNYCSKREIAGQNSPIFCK